MQAATRSRTILALALSAAALGATPGAHAQGTSPSPPPAAIPDPAFEAARAAFEGLPESERRAIQDALVWTGDYNGTTVGGFGRRTYEGIVAYQKRAKLPASGVLDAKGKAALQVSAQKAKEAIGFAMVDDARTGARLGLPRKVFVKSEPAPGQGGGTRWQSADGKITLDTRSYDPGEQELPVLFERLVNFQLPGRQVTYKLLRPDFFVLSGETQTGKFYIRYGAGSGGVRGYTLGYDKALAKDFDRTVIAIANSFAPFPAAGAATAAAPTALPPARPPQPEPPALAATGVMVGPRKVLTSAAVAACPDIRVAGAKARAVATEGTLTLVELDADRKAPPVTLQGAGSPDLVVLAFAAQGGAPTLTAAPAAETGGASLVAPLQPGATGAPAFDRSGALAGIVGALPASPRQIAGVVPTLTHPLAPASAVGAFLSANGVAIQTSADSRPRSVGEIAATLGAAVVPISCGR